VKVTRSVTSGNPGFSVRWLGRFAVMEAPSAFDSACLDTLMRAARRARGWGAWLRLVIPDAGVRRVVRLVALNQVMPVHASVTAAVEAAVFEAAALEADGGAAAGK
jgi:hypothetical protein